MKHIPILAAALSLSACATPRVVHEKGAVAVREFSFPWSAKPAPRTEFNARIIGERLHFSFDCADADLVIAKKWRGESTLDNEDRVEIFFARDAALARYFCIEIDPVDRVHDYAASHYRKFDSAWNCPGLRPSARPQSAHPLPKPLPAPRLSILATKPPRTTHAANPCAPPNARRFSRAPHHPKMKCARNKRRARLSPNLQNTPRPPAPPVS